MWRSATSSEWRARAAAAALALTSLAAPAAARVLLSVDEALRLAFPESQVERGTVFLTPAQIAAAEERAGGDVPGIVHPYRARRDGEVVGTAYFDTHRVRTLAETVMVVVDPEGRVRRVEVLSFDEPPDYLPRAEWYRQFDGRPLSPGLAVGRDLRGVTGATLTVRATGEAVRRVLAVHAVIHAAGRDGGPGAPP